LSNEKTAGPEKINDKISENIVFTRKSESLQLIPQPLLLKKRRGARYLLHPLSLKKREGERG